LYGPVLEVSLTVDVSAARLGSVTVSVTDGAMMDVNGIWNLDHFNSGNSTYIYMSLRGTKFYTVVDLSRAPPSDIEVL
jgi:hypothetical protein